MRKVVVEMGRKQGLEADYAAFRNGPHHVGVTHVPCGQLMYMVDIDEELSEEELAAWWRDTDDLMILHRKECRG